MRTPQLFAVLLIAAAVPVSAQRFEPSAGAGLRWFKGNTHAHTLESDGDSPPEVVARWYRDHGYNFLVLSDHNVFTDPSRLHSLLDSTFILIGGAAATVHGSSRLTRDVDVVYRRTRENITRLVAALTPYQPYLRGAPPGLPFRWDVATIERGLNFTLTTTIGALDVLGEIVGGGGYDALMSSTSLIRAFDVECRCLNLDRLIEVKRATGRPKDLEAVAELEAIREERASDTGRDG